MMAQAARLRRLGVGKHVVRHAVRRDHALVVGDLETVEDLCGMPQSFPVAGGAHEEGDGRGHGLSVDSLAIEGEA
jgi:hypothetical protein